MLLEGVNLDEFVGEGGEKNPHQSLKRNQGKKGKGKGVKRWRKRGGVRWQRGGDMWRM